MGGLEDAKKASAAEVEAAIAEAEKFQKEGDNEIAQAKAAMDAASSERETLVHRETIAVEKIKASLNAKMEAASDTKKAIESRETAAKQMLVLEMEAQARKNVGGLEDAKKASHAEVEAAKQRLEEAKAKEKEAAEAFKHRLIAQREKESALLEEKEREGELEGAVAKAEAKLKDKAEKAAVSAELKDIEKMRQARDKERQQMIKEAAGVKRKFQKALMAPEAAVSPTKSAPRASPAKAARIEDVD